MKEYTISEIGRQMAAGALSARALVEDYLERIEALDRAGPTLNSVIELNPDALEIADALDIERLRDGARGPLHGVPLLLKDNIDTADRMTTTAGSLALEGTIAPQDATVAAKLRAAGAVILGKANLSEWANFRSNRSTSGWSSRGGQTLNPYALDRNPCGSSSGSAVAVAANLCAAAIGTETDGSIVCPSHANSIVGIKPTLGLVSRAGIIPIAHSQDTAGPMGRCVADAAAVLGAIVGSDPRDPVTTSVDSSTITDYTQFLIAGGLRGARIGVARNFFGSNPRVDEIMEACIKRMREMGAEIVDPANIVTAGDLDEPELEVLLYEFKADLNAYLAERGAATTVRSMKEIIAFNEQHRGRVMPYFGQEWMLKAEEKGSLTDESYVEALAKCRRLARDEGIDATLKEHALDAIVAPTGGPPWLTDWVNGDHFSGSSSSPAAVAGYPNITVPAGYIFGLPVGISFFGAAFSEPILIRLAYTFEQGTLVRRKPEFRSTAALDPADARGNELGVMED
jgi:amidase